MQSFTSFQNTKDSLDLLMHCLDATRAHNLYHSGDNRREEILIEEANYAALKYRGSGA